MAARLRSVLWRAKHSRVGQAVRRAAGWRLWRYFTVVRVLGFLLLLGVLGLVYLRYSFDWKQLGAHLFDNAVAEVLGLVFAVLVIDALNQVRAARQERERLVLQMGSPDRAFAMEAVRQLRWRGWLTDGSLRGARLGSPDIYRAPVQAADLSGVDLRGANLPEASLAGVNLQGALLDDANLPRANLYRANLRGARLSRANLKGAGFPEADLQGAFLDGADLRGAGLGRVHMEGAHLNRADLRGALLQRVHMDGVSLHYANLQGAELSDAKLYQADLNAANLRGAVLALARLGGSRLTDEQLVQAHTLIGALMPSGSKYDGRFSLDGDVAYVREQGVDTGDPAAVARLHVVSLGDYRRGQEWAREHLEDLRAKSEEWYKKHWSGDKYQP